MPMTPGTKKREPVKPTRYDPYELAKRWERERIRRDVSVKKICDWPALVWERSHYSRKVRLDPTEISISEWGVLCDALERLSGQPVPIGFPFIPIEVGQVLEPLGRGTRKGP